MNRADCADLPEVTVKLAPYDLTRAVLTFGGQPVRGFDRDDRVVAGAPPSTCRITITLRPDSPNTAAVLDPPGMHPFFCLYGGKWRAAPHYPAPRFGRVIEPFAGAAGYATRHHERDVVLVEADPAIAGLWRWLISAPAREVLALPAEVPDTVDALGLAPGPSALIGFWINKGAASPRQRPSAWMRQGLRPRSFWGPEIRARIASQVDGIRHWTLIEGDFSQAPGGEATYFVDPPYVGAGVHYRKRFDRHAELGEWCKARRGQVIACENVGATWLPFEPFKEIKATESRTGGKRSAEAIWLGP